MARRIMHIDLDAFFVAVEQVENPIKLDRIRPLIVYSDVLPWHILMDCATLTPGTTI